MFEWNQNFRYPSRFVVTGTDTGVGKTVISTLLTLVLEGTYWKPIQAGVSPSSDRDVVLQEGGIPLKRVWKEAYCFERALSPHAASKAEGVTISFDQLMIPPVEKGPLIIEGVGGILTPLTDETLFIDLVKFWNLPVVVVARSTLGTINHSLLTLEALRARNIPVLGVFFNGPGNQANRDAVSRLGKVEVLGEMYPVDDLRQYCESLKMDQLTR